MKKLILSSLSLLLLSACVQDDGPGGGSNVNRPVGGLELTSLATQGGKQQLTFFKVNTMNVPAAREVLSLSGAPAEALRSIDYAPNGTLYGMGVVQSGDETTQCALYTIEPLSGVATEVVQFELPFVPDDLRFVPGTNSRQIRINEYRQQVVRPYTALVDVTSGAVSQVAQVDAGQGLGIRTAITAFDYSEGQFIAIVGDGLTGYVQQLARAPIGRETTLGSFARMPPHIDFFTSFVADATVGYGTLTNENRPSKSPALTKVNINFSSPSVGELEEIATFPVSQLSLAETPESVVKARQER